ncbi:proline-serine-threonine phosphatase-interacting protein 2-like isoform X2 [Lathamus discolor]|uniref:proline-serine-threonine phosphatase-interacting protein 2-like isoform X2 n=1 Tax=Lathamus discolor TaxID=678569 RepID=UPI0032B86468
MVSDVLSLALLSSQLELIMEAIHKTRNLKYKKTIEAKHLHEQCCKDKDEAEHNKLLCPPTQTWLQRSSRRRYREFWQLFLSLAQMKSSPEDSGRSYQQSVTTPEKIREEWQRARQRL